MENYRWWEIAPLSFEGVRPGRGEPSCVHVTLTFPPQEIDFWLIIHLAEETLRRINHISSQKLLKLLSSSNLAYCKGLKRGCEANWWLVLLFFWGLLILVPAGSPLEMWSKYQCFQSSQSDTWTARDNPRVFDRAEKGSMHILPDFLSWSVLSCLSFSSTLQILAISLLTCVHRWTSHACSSMARPRLKVATRTTGYVALRHPPAHVPGLPGG